MATRKKRAATQRKPSWAAPITSLLGDFFITALLPILTMMIAEVN
jgi:hypothetical protein